MKKFAECFSDYLQRYDMPFKRAALLCEIDRTLLRRYAKGDRMPKSEETVHKIAKGLSMDREEEEKLCLAYRRSRMGERQYCMNGILDKIRNYVQEADTGWKQEACFTEEEKAVPAPESVQRLFGQQEIMLYLKKIFWEAEDMMLLMNPHYPEILKLMQTVFEQNPECHAEHIMRMSSFYNEDNIEDVVNFESVFPLLAAAEHYKIFHHYCWDGVEEAEKSELNICLTNKGVVLFDLEMQYGIFSNQKHYRRYFIENFQQQKQHCSLFAEVDFVGSAGREETMVENFVEGGDAGIMLVSHSGGRESVLIRTQCRKEKEIYLEEEGIIHLVKNYLLS